MVVVFSFSERVHLNIERLKTNSMMEEAKREERRRLAEQTRKNMLMIYQEEDMTWEERVEKNKKARRRKLVARMKLVVHSIATMYKKRVHEMEIQTEEKFSAKARLLGGYVRDAIEILCLYMDISKKNNHHIAWKMKYRTTRVVKYQSCKNHRKTRVVKYKCLQSDDPTASICILQLWFFTFRNCCSERKMWYFDPFGHHFQFQGQTPVFTWYSKFPYGNQLPKMRNILITWSD